MITRLLKTCLIGAICLFASSPLLAQNCGSTVLRTQADVNAFDCENVEGRLTITGSDIVDLAPLSRLNQVRGLFIYNNPSLTSLSGLENLQNVQNTIEIVNNDSLATLEGLSMNLAANQFNLNGNALLEDCCIINSLDGVNNFNISNNAPGCSTLSGIEAACLEIVCTGDFVLRSQAEIDTFSCTQVTGTLSISSTDPVSLQPLNQLKQVGTLAIDFLVAENLSGLENLETIDQDVLIQSAVGFPISTQGLGVVGSIRNLTVLNSSDLQDFAGFTGLDSIRGELNIQNNSQIRDFHGLNQVKSIGSLVVSENRRLTSFSGFDSLRSINLFATIERNNALDSLTGLGQLQFVGGNFTIRENPELSNLTGLGMLNQVAGLFQIGGFHPSFSLTGLEGLTQVDFLEVNANSSLTNLNGLNNLEEAMGITLERLPNLVSLDGLEGLRRASRISIQSNTILSDISALSNYDTSFTTSLTLSFNQALNDCCILVPFINADNISLNLLLNAAGCQSEADILANCPTTAIQGLAKAKLWPNPITHSGHLVFEHLPSDAQAHYELTDLSGNKIVSGVFKGGAAEIAQNGVDKGLYLCKIYVNGQAGQVIRVAVE